MKKILNVVVCYENEEEVISYLNQLECQEKYLEIIFVVSVNRISNSENYHILNERLKDSSIECYIYSTGENLGYLNGLLFGYKMYCDECKNIDFLFVIFSNTDIEYNDKLFFKTLSLSDYDKSILCIGPSVYDSNRKTFRNPYIYKRYSKLELLIRIIMFNNPLFIDFISKINSKKDEKKVKKMDSQFTYGVHGSYFILKSELIKKLFHYYPWVLLYGEELLVAEILKKEKKKCFYDSNLVITHNSGTTTSRQKDKIVKRLMASANKRIIKEFY